MINTILIALAVNIGGLLYSPYDEVKFSTDIIEGNNVIAYFTADWCIYCKYFKRDVLNDPNYLLKSVHYKRYIVDVTKTSDEERRVMDKFGIDGLPSLLIIKDGKWYVSRDKSEIDRILDGS